MHQLLVIEDEATPAEASVRAMLGTDPCFCCEPVAWHGLVPESLNHRKTQAVVAVAVPHTPHVTRVFDWLHDHPIRTPTLAVLPADSSEPLLRSAAEAADDFVLAPLRGVELRHRLGRMLGLPSAEVEAVRERLLEELGMAQLVGRDPVFLKAVEQIRRFARSDMSVLITGETGTGKELCARAIHLLGIRRDSPFIPIDCGALPDHLIENELFGHARGAYTDAHRDQRGLIAMADRGTLFLDEIDALSLPAQSKLLRFLQERTFRPLGSDRFEHSDVKVIAATNRDLETAVRDRQFRADLFYRLNVLRLDLPPLRDRRGDIELLAAHSLQECGPSGRATARSFSPAALRMLALHDWPGNVRELANVVQQAVAVCETPMILGRHLSLPRAVSLGSPTNDNFRDLRAAAVETFERRYVEDLLRAHGGNVTRAARAAQKDRRVLGRLIKKYGINRTSF